MRGEQGIEPRRRGRRAARWRVARRPEIARSLQEIAPWSSRLPRRRHGAILYPTSPLLSAADTAYVLMAPLTLDASAAAPTACGRSRCGSPSASLNCKVGAVPHVPADEQAHLVRRPRGPRLPVVDDRQLPAAAAGGAGGGALWLAPSSSGAAVPRGDAGAAHPRRGRAGDGGDAARTPAPSPSTPSTLRTSSPPRRRRRTRRSRRSCTRRTTAATCSARCSGRRARALARVAADLRPLFIASATTTLGLGAFFLLPPPRRAPLPSLARSSAARARAARGPR